MSNISNTESIASTTQPERLSDGRYLIVCDLADGIDPVKWTDLCKELATLNPGALEAFAREVDRRLDELQ